MRASACAPLTIRQETRYGRYAHRPVTAATLAAFSDAFNRHDANALMGFMTEDCVFDAAGGPDIHGTRFVGRDAVRAAFEAVFKTFPDAHWGHGRHTVAGERGVSEWVFTGTHAEGWRIEARLRPVRIPRRTDRRQACLPQGTAEAAGLSAATEPPCPARILKRIDSFHSTFPGSGQNDLTGLPQQIASGTRRSVN